MQVSLAPREWLYDLKIAVMPLISLLRKSRKTTMIERSNRSRFLLEMKRKSKQCILPPMEAGNHVTAANNSPG